MNSGSEKTMVQPDMFCTRCKDKLMPCCPKCGGRKVTRNGTTDGRQNFRCGNPDCKKQFVSDPTRRRITAREWRVVDSLLKDGADVPMIHRATGISKRHIYYRKKSRGEN